MGKNDLRRDHDVVKPFVIFAVNTPLDKRAELEHVKLKMKGWGDVKQLVGSYRCKQENCYLVTLPDDKLKSKLGKVIDVALEHKQASILLVNDKREAMLLYLNISSGKEIGKFTPVTPSEALQEESWTLDGNQFYICK